MLEFVLPSLARRLSTFSQRQGIALALTAALGWTTSAFAQAPRPFLFSMGRYTATWAGRPPSYDIACWNHMQQIGATMAGAGLAWVDGEPTRGQINMTAVAEADTAVDEIRARGMEVNFFLGLTPAWAALYPNLEPHRTPAAEAYVDDFMNFHRWVANRYKGKVKYYFFWNEPNGCSWINPGCSNGNGFPLYTQWLIRCSQAVKQADPDAKIIAGRLDYHAGVTSGVQYIQGMYNNGAGPHIDGIAIHPYDWAGTIHWQAITDTRAVMVANGDANKPIWLSEYGWNLTNYQETASRLTQVLTELKKPEWSFVQMANYLVLNDGPGVENYGLMNADLVARPGYTAFKNFDKSWPQAVDFTATPTSGYAPLSVQFTDASNVNGATAWLWEFGDGQTSSTRHPSHFYASPGSYNVKLTVTGTDGPQSRVKTAFITVSSTDGLANVRNPSFEENGGSLSQWTISIASGGGPDQPPLSNGSFGVSTPFGTRFAGAITSWGTTSFTLGQVISAVRFHPQSTSAQWSWSAHAQMHARSGSTNYPGNVHQVWEIGWNNDGSLPSNINACQQYQTIVHLTGTHTGNHPGNFFPFSGSGQVTGVTDLKGVALRVRLYNDYGLEWNMFNTDNVSFSIQTIPPVIPGDLDGDGDVDLDDFGSFQACTTGPAMGPPPSGCGQADFDGDGDVDLFDFSVVQRCFGGAAIPADVNCGN